MQALDRGDFDTLLVWKLDRLSRQGIGAMGPILDRLEGTGRRIVSVMDGVDTSQPQGRIMVALLSEMARSESANTSVRIKSSFEQARREGRWTYGLPPWGFLLENGKIRPDPDTYEEARSIVAAILAGQSLRSIAADLNARGVVRVRKRPDGSTTDPVVWRASALGGWTRSPALKGHLPRGRRTRATHRLDGEAVIIGEGIVSEAEWQQLQTATVSTRELEPNREGQAGPRSLRSRLLFSLQRQDGAAPRSWRCSNRQQIGTCDGVSVSTEPMESYVERLLLGRISSLDLDDPLLLDVSTAWAGTESGVERSEHEKQASALVDAEARLADLMAARYERNEFDGAPPGTFDGIRDRLALEVSTAAATLAGSGFRHDPVESIGYFGDVEILAETWEVTSLSDRQAVARVMIERVDVAKGQPGKPFDGPSRITVAWH